MYRTAVITDEITQDLEIAAQMASQYGLAALEIRSVNGKNPFDMGKNDIKAIKKIAQEYGLAICAVAPPLFKCDLEDEKTYRSHIDGAARSMEAANEWGANIIRGFTFWNRQKQDQEFFHIAELYQPVIKLAEKSGVRIALESEPSVGTCTIELLAKFLNIVDNPMIGALYDPGNEVCSTSTPPPYPDGYELIKENLLHVHIKDMKRGGIPAMLGEGDVDFHSIFKRLRLDDYAGYVSIETHYRIQTDQLDEELLVRPQGSAFSAGGQEATKAYLTELRDTYKWMEE